MYTQFFGSYLLQRGVIDQGQLMDAITKMSTDRIKIGTIAMTKGLMTPSEVDECLYVQTREDKKFGEIAIERGYLTQPQVNELLSEQTSDFLLLGQILVEAGCFSNADLERLVFEYRADNEFYDLEISIDNKDRVDSLIEKFFVTSELPVTDKAVMYLKLLFNSLIRFIGDDFTPLSPVPITEYPVSFAICQKIEGQRTYMTTVDMDRTAAIEFASRYANESFNSFNEYIIASVEDFINLHNGLFLVNVSNETTEELKLLPPFEVESGLLPVTDSTVLLPVVYPFGKINLIVSF